MFSSFKQLKSCGRSLRYLSMSRSQLSAQVSAKRYSIADIQELHRQRKPISMITAYDYISGKYAEKADIEVVLVGDSLAMVSLGYESTNEITLDEFLYHVRAVFRGNRTSLLVSDVPFGYFEESTEQAVRTAARFIREGKVQALKLEGGRAVAPTVEKLTSIGVPVMGHVGLMPQHHNALGGFKVQGTSVADAVSILDDCRALEKAGAFAVVLECVPAKLAEKITQNLTIPTIGIGAGPHCSGQVLVMSDILGMGDPSETTMPKFVKQYGDFFSHAVRSLAQYKKDVQRGSFPDVDIHSYKIKKDVLSKFTDKLN
ncbi:Piso0_000860 [Millerozyma farinosa CBS 7064]|uniref:3-methyl-2-oxobutanoate hydroxymethyltransferase n=1 Tax=Pichia sorbitophila (strain ATCC MYA-4447 / BCRC 22081 / CBS 7064 / NBRC 10061 / NRRL Y-12695) TaxID=559304 RepID=G8YQ94_PICSO|nr:Piso0_000860 [Millerozyma farinosa CBS 7064]